MSEKSRQNRSNEELASGNLNRLIFSMAIPTIVAQLINI